ncbi:MAG: transporter [Sulfurimonas sp.]|uniref:transporter n=1 Tax=Sulfurimonas sp. TaxID=2022749 RepID=UPI00260E6097|nr:transporter [Sulfurimonas sp.]MDD5373694.1 transporter [Sulfurimonas sp.]
MKKIIMTSLLMAPILLNADVIPAINSKGGAQVLPEGKLKMEIKHINFERNSMFDGTNEVQNREKLDATANITMIGLNYGLNATTTVGAIIPYKNIEATAQLGTNAVAIDNEGLGDIILVARHLILPMSEYGFQLSLDGGVKLPTGSTNSGFKKAPSFATGINTPMPTQMGTGEFEYKLGAGFSYMINESWEIDTHAMYTYRPKANNSYDFGNEINLDLSTTKAITKQINLGIEYNFSYNSATNMGYDTNAQLRSMLPFKAFSGSAGYITPQIEFLPFGKPKIHFGAGVSFLANYDLKEYQPLEKERFIIRMGYLF